MKSDAAAVDSKPCSGATLALVRGPGRGTVLPIVGAELLIGRLGSNHVVVDDPAVSRVHARVARGADGVRVEDLGSRSGTFVNGRRLEGAVRLADGDEIVVGPVALVFSAGA